MVDDGEYMMLGGRNDSPLRLDSTVVYYAALVESVTVRTWVVTSHEVFVVIFFIFSSQMLFSFINILSIYLFYFFTEYSIHRQLITIVNKTI